MITICTNTETVAQSLEGPGVSASVARAAAEMWSTEQLADIVYGSGAENWQTSKNFRDWHSGRRCFTYGLVAYDDLYEAELAVRVDRAINARLAELVALELRSLAESEPAGTSEVEGL